MLSTTALSCKDAPRCLLFSRSTIASREEIWCVLHAHAAVRERNLDVDDRFHRVHQLVDELRLHPAAGVIDADDRAAQSHAEQHAHAVEGSSSYRQIVHCLGNPSPTATTCWKGAGAPSPDGMAQRSISMPGLKSIPHTIHAASAYLSLSVLQMQSRHLCKCSCGGRARRGVPDSGASKM